ncbi:MAG: DegT/DnrJ/EryC1/StrS aminotransferase family protein [Flavobacteriales bacterium]|nr:DegT/DnrJ/EryC1/StrS aminotransferase family protein [Flavobacteriales bacterium]
MIPFSPPRIDDKTIAEVTDALQSGWITTGPKTKLFEEKLATFIGVKHVVCLNSATAGMQLILNWLGVKKGDEVIVPAYTYCATANVVIHAGAKPVMVDVNEDDFNISINAVRNAITPKTKAIISVDIAGYPADYDELHQLVRDKDIQSLFNPENVVQEKINRIAIVADAAHSIGAIYKGNRTGNQADMSSFSFHAVKNLTTAEGGAVTFNLKEFSSQELQQKFKVSSLHGQTKDAFSKNQIGAWKYDVVEAGFKCNMTDLQAAIGLVELKRYKETLARRKTIFEKYQNTFSKKAWAKVPLFSSNNKTSSYHLYMLRIKDISEDKRDTIIAKISEKEVAVNVHYLPLAMLTYYRNKGYAINDYPQTYENYKAEITLPVYYNLTDSQVETVINAVVESVEEVI